MSFMEKKKIRKSYEYMKTLEQNLNGFTCEVQNKKSGPNHN
jgi:hypothetical protein